MVDSATFVGELQRCRVPDGFHVVVPEVPCGARLMSASRYATCMPTTDLFLFIVLKQRDRASPCLVTRVSSGDELRREVVKYVTTLRLAAVLWPFRDTRLAEGAVTISVPADTNRAGILMVLRKKPRPCRGIFFTGQPEKRGKRDTAPGS